MARNRWAKRRRKEREEKKCLNCSETLEGRYCHYCGQENIEQKEPIGKVILYLLEGLTFFNSKFFKTLKPFLTKPGFLTKEYNSGKRASFLSPVKTYFFLSFLYFLLYFTVGVNYDNTVELDIGMKSLSDSTINNLKQRDSINNEIEITKTKEYDNWFSKKIQKLQKEAIENGSNKTLERMNNSFMSNIPKVVFFVMPFLALILKLFYRRYYYIEHLIHSLHIHSFAFLILTLSLFLKLAFNLNGGGIGVIAAAIIILYFIISLYKVHQQKVGTAIIKAVSSLILYIIIFGIGFLANILITIAFA